MNSRRLILFTLLILASIFAIVMITKESTPVEQPEYSGTKWMISMPQLEQYQRDNPGNILMSSDGWDPRLPEKAFPGPDSDNPENESMFRDFLDCGASGVVFNAQWNEKDASKSKDEFGATTQMPPRYSVWTTGVEVENCILAALPEGYKMKRDIQ